MVAAPGLLDFTLSPRNFNSMRELGEEEKGRVTIRVSLFLTCCTWGRASALQMEVRWEGESLSHAYHYNMDWGRIRTSGSLPLTGRHYRARLGAGEIGSPVLDEHTGIELSQH